MGKAKERIRNRRKMTKQTKDPDQFRLFRSISFVSYSLCSSFHHKIRQGQQFSIDITQLKTENCLLKTDLLRPLLQLPYAARHLIHGGIAFEQDRMMQHQHPGIGG
jgi:hypothetical protein